MVLPIAPQAVEAIPAIRRAIRLVGHSEVVVVAAGDILGGGRAVVSSSASKRFNNYHGRHEG